MASRGIAALIVAAGIAASSAGAVANAHPRGGTCDPPGSHTIVANHFTRAFRLNRRVKYGDILTYAYVCRYATGRSLDLGEWDYYQPEGPGDYVHPIRLEGHYVAYVVGADGNHSGGYSVHVLDILTWRIVHYWNAEYTDEDGHIFAKLGATRTGAVAWTTWDVSADQTLPNAATVWASDKTGEHRVLESGPGVNARSLAVIGNKAIWRDNGERRQALLR